MDFLGVEFEFCHMKNVLGWLMEMVAQWRERALCHRAIHLKWEKTVNFTLCLCCTIQKMQLRKERFADTEKCWISSPWYPVKQTVKDARCPDAWAACREATWEELRLPVNSVTNVPIMGIRRSRLNKPLDDSSPHPTPLSLNLPLEPPDMVKQKDRMSLLCSVWVPDA